MARIALLLTKTPWGDRRQFHRQGPALVRAGHHVVYMAGQPDRELPHPFEYVVLDDRERALARRTGGLNLFGKIRRANLDLIQLCSVELLPLGIALKLFGGPKVVYDCREDIASALRERRKSLPSWARDLVFRTVRALEGAAARTFDGIVTADPGVFALHARMPDDRKHIFYNTALLSQFPHDYAPLEARPFELVVLGSMSSERSGAHEVLDALGILANRGRRPRLLLIGEPEGGVTLAVASRIEKHGLEDQVEITGHLPHHEVARTLATARIGIVPLLDYPKFHRNIACKAFEYMACGMPTISSELPPQHLFLHDAIARFYPCSDIEALADRIEELLDAPALCAEMGAQARREVEERWNGERAQDDYVAFYQSLLDRRAR